MAEHEGNSVKHEFKRLLAPVRIADQSWPEGTRPLVSILCITYNHEKYIKECLEGFLMQETTFPVEIIIHDDASIDGTPSILRKYSADHPKLFRLILQQENKFSKNIRPTPIAIAKSKGVYVAFCDGDDYWVDKKKIERQVSLLESDEKAQLCFHSVYLETAEKTKVKPVFPDLIDITQVTWSEILMENLVPTSTVVAKREAVLQSPSWFSKMLMGDWPRWVMACLNGPALAINEPMTVYRRHEAGVWSGLSKARQFDNKITFYYVMENYGPQMVAAAARRKREVMINALFLRLEAKPDVVVRLSKHKLFGPILRFWKKFVNPNFPDFSI